MDDEYIRDIADVIERDVEAGEPMDAGVSRPQKAKGCGAIAMGLESKRSDKFAHIEEELMGPPKNTNVQNVDDDQEESKE